jgi:hypothetical protein
MSETLEGGTEGSGIWVTGKAVLALLAGFLLAPLVFLFDLGIRFALVEFSCRQNEFAIWTVLIAALALAGGGLLAAWSSWKKLNETAEQRRQTEEGSAQSTGHTLSDELRTDEGGPHGRSRFLALAGIAMSTFFLAIIVLSIIPKLLLDPCM